MKSNLLFVYFFFAFNSFIYSQISNLVFVGSAVLKGGQAYSYKLQLNEKDGQLTGYSVTDLMGPNETKTSVKGTLNREKKQIDFHETKMVYTKSKFSASDFCFIHGHVRITKMQGAISLKGTFKGLKDDNKTECGSGKLTLVSAQDILDKLLKIADKDSAMHRMADTIRNELSGQTVIRENEIPPSQILKLQPGNTLNIAVPTPEIDIEIWDAKSIDGDRVSIFQNEKIILENYSINAIHKKVHISMDDEKQVSLKLVALNEGDEPPNTSRLKIVSGIDTFYIDATTTMEKTVLVILNRQK